METGIAQLIVQGGIGGAALIFALYIFKTSSDNTKELIKAFVDTASGNIKEQAQLINEFKDHSNRMLDEMKDIVSAIQTKKSEGL